MSDYFKRAIVSFLWLLLVFACVMGSFCITINSDTRGCFLLSIVYYFPTLWLVLLCSLFVLQRNKVVIGRKWDATLFAVSTIYVLLIEGLALAQIITIDDFEFAGLIVSIFLIAFVLARPRVKPDQ